MLNVLSAVGIAAFHVFSDGKVLDLNSAARDLVGRFVTITGGKLRPIQGNASDIFEGFIPGPSAITHPDDQPSHIVLRSREGGFAVCSRVAKLERQTAGVGILVLVRVVSTSAFDVTRILIEDLQLSPAEARLAITLHRYCDLGEAAAALGLSKETVRSQIRSVFAKLNLRKQSEVVRLIEQILASTFGL